MVSELLTSKGLKVYLAGSHYNFRSQNQKDLPAEITRTLKDGQFDQSGLVLYFAHQVHGDQVAYVDGDGGEPVQEEPVKIKYMEESDGLITDREDLVLMIKFADCTPIIFFDPVKKVQASVHSGWRSTKARIGQVAVRKMQDQFQCQLEDIYAFIGPTIAWDDYEVGQEVFDAFADFKSRDKFFKPCKQADKHYLNMGEANYQILLEAGLSPDHIERSSQTTFADDSLHSARREGADYLLNALFTQIFQK